MLPTAFEEFARSIIAVCVFLSNVLFWRESGYFAADAEEKPLLHTWSLAVEEQYYVIFPLFLALLWRFRGQWALIGTASAAAVSLVLCEWATRHYPDANFYLLPTRAWELLTGSLCAFWQSSARRRSFGGADPWLASAGLALIVFAIFAFDEHTPFPSIYALVPVLGAALFLLFADEDRAAGWILARRAPVSIGLISYSAYLWHQPLFAFARIRSMNEPSLLLMGALAGLALILAFFTWRFVEAPFRAPGYAAAPRRGLNLSQRGILLSASAGLIGFVVLGVIMTQIPAQQNSQSRAALASIEDWRDIDRCAINARPREGQIAECLRGMDTGRPIFLIGDSHAGAISKTLRKSLQDQGYTLISFTHPACYPVVGLHRLPEELSQSCQAMLRQAYSVVADFSEAPVVLFARWAKHIDPTRFDNGEGGVEARAGQPLDVSDPAFPKTDDPKTDIMVYTLQQLGELAQERRLFLLGGFPEAGWDVPLRLQKLLKFEGKAVSEISISADRVRTRLEDTEAMLEQLTSKGAVHVPLIEMFCSDGPTARCVHYDGETLFYRDEDHPSPDAAARISDALIGLLP